MVFHVPRSRRQPPAIADTRGSRLPFRPRLLLGALLALALVGVAGGLAWHQYSDQRQAAVNDARTRVILASTLIDTYLGGQLATLSSVAQSPPVLARNAPGMQSYFARIEPARGGGIFTGGVAWIDRRGIVRVSSNGAAGAGHDVSDRSYFKTAMATGAAFVSEGLESRRTHRHVIVMAVPTRDAHGRLTGVLAGALLVNAFQAGSGSLDLGFNGLVVLDRRGGAVLTGFGRPRNRELAAQLQRGQVGLLSRTRGLDGGADHLVAYATAQIPDWTIVIDRPRSEVFAAARRSLLLELALIAATATVVFGLIGWLIVRARREAERQSARALQRGELSHVLSAASVADEVARGLATGLAAAFPGARSIVTLEAEDRLGLRFAADGGAGRPLGVHTNDLVATHASMGPYESGAPRALENEVLLRETLPELHGALAGAWRSLYCAPLRAAGSRAAGAVCLLFEDERALDEAEQAHIAWYAEEGAQALERARAYEHEHAVAVSLQRSLLSQELPAIDGVELLGRYRAGGAGLEVGGDWYDVVRRNDGTVLITVGDVAGRGLTAAVLMGQMRNAFRAYAYDHSSPGEVLRRMRRHISDDEMATAVCMALDPFTQQLTYASAGHPPPLLLAGSDGEVSRLDRAGAPPLGFAPAHAIREVDVPLRTGATVVTYTDGLIERRDWTIDTGIDLLADVIAASSTLGVHALASRIVGEVADRVGSGDDIALLLVHLCGVPARMDIEISGDPTALAGLRRRLRAWLALRGLSEPERDDAVLAVGEACNNAIEHAFGGAAGALHLRVEHRAQELEVTVEDRGSRLPARSNPERDRGIERTRAVMHDTRIESAPGGTRVTLSHRLSR